MRTRTPVLEISWSRRVAAVFLESAMKKKCHKPGELKNSILPSPLGGSHGGSMVKNFPAMQETWVRSLGREDPLEEMTTHSSILGWEIPWTEEPGGLRSMGSPRVGHDLATKPPPVYNRTHCIMCAIHTRDITYV